MRGGSGRRSGEGGRRRRPADRRRAEGEKAREAEGRAPSHRGSERSPVFFALPLDACQVLSHRLFTFRGLGLVFQGFVSEPVLKDCHLRSSLVLPCPCRHTCVRPIRVLRPDTASRFLDPASSERPSKRLRSVLTKTASFMKGQGGRNHLPHALPSQGIDDADQHDYKP